MTKGISNFEIQRVFREINNNDLNENFLVVFPSDKINKFIMIERMVPGKENPFIISNTDCSDKNGTHWWSILNISPKSELFFIIIILLELMEWNISFFKTIKKLLEMY